MASDPNDLCPHCGVPVPLRRRKGACPHCGRAFAAQEAQPDGPHLTPFGYGVCGAVAGAQIGAAIALADPNIRLGDPRLTLFPILGGAACAVVAAGIGARLVPDARRGFEVAAAAVLCGSFATAVASLMGLGSAEALVCVGTCVAVGAGAIIRSRLSRQRTTGGLTREC